MLKLRKGLIYFIGINMIVLGIDKFFAFIPDPCSLVEGTDSIAWKIIGVLEIALGFLLFAGKYVKIILALIVMLMVWAIAMHLFKGTYDIGGAVFLGGISLIPMLMREKVII